MKMRDDPKAYLKAYHAVPANRLRAAAKAATPEARARRVARQAAARGTRKREEYLLRVNALRSGYQITLDERDERLDAQGHRCAVCRRPFRTQVWHLTCTFTGKVTGRRLPQAMVDHDHDTGLVRGLLCGWCNKDVVTLFEKYPEMMVRARRYVLAGGWETE